VALSAPVVRSPARPPNAPAAAEKKESEPLLVFGGGIFAIPAGLLLLLAPDGWKLAGVALITAAVLSLYLTRFGTRWNALPGGQRLLAFAGIAASGLVLALTFGLFMAWLREKTGTERYYPGNT
jgi:multisubunit Na+/H+ antiporter MnhB subunit